jgi:glycosyltransferase involved in cell wall biosynthesis
VRLTTAVVVPSYNHETFVGEAIQSALDQTRAPDEVIVVDDGSTDDSRVILESVRAPAFRVFLQPNLGAHAALNRGIAESKADLIFILNSDDSFAPERVDHFARLFEADAELALAGSWLEVVDGSGRRLAVKEAWHNLEPWPLGPPEQTFQGTEDPRANLLQTNYLSTTSNFVVRRSVWERHGPFRPLRYAHDWDFALRVARTEKMRIVPSALLRYRVHDRNTIRENRTAMEFEILWVLAANVASYLDPSLTGAGGSGGRNDFLERLYSSIHTFGHDRVFWLLAVLGSAEGDGAGFRDLLDPENGLRNWFLERMR